jgi:hypothetical protein
MRKSRRAVLAIAAVGALLPTGTASAVSTGDAPPRHPVRHAAPSWGHIKICKHGLDTFDVYADGMGKTWQDTLDTGPTSCTVWGAMRPGMYDIAFTLTVASQQHVVFIASYVDNRGRHCRKAFEGQGVMSSLLLPGKLIRIDLHAKRLHHSVA